MGGTCGLQRWTNCARMQAKDRAHKLLTLKNSSNSSKPMNRMYCCLTCTAACFFKFDMPSLYSNFKAAWYFSRLAAIWVPISWSSAFLMAATVTTPPSLVSIDATSLPPNFSGAAIRSNHLWPRRLGLQNKESTEKTSWSDQKHLSTQTIDPSDPQFYTKATRQALMVF